MNLPCYKCKDGKGVDFVGTLGGKIEVLLNISFAKVAGSVDIVFNGTKIVKIETGFSRIIVTITPMGKNKRFELQTKMDPLAIGTYKIIYKDLTIADHGVKFSYTSTDAGRPVTVSNTIVVHGMSRLFS